MSNNAKNKLTMFFDTETSGLWDFKGAFNSTKQPFLMQLGYKIYDDQRRVIHEIGCLVNTTDQEGFDLQEGAYNAHHISKEMCRDYGYNPKRVMNEFQHWADRCDTFVAHNTQFDVNVLQCFAFRENYNPGEVFGQKNKLCTMLISTPICKIPNAKGYGNKWPKLIEAYLSLVSKTPFADAHNALADVNACADIFFALEDKGLIPNANANM